MNVSNDVLGVLERARLDGRQLRITESLERKLYLDVNKILVALGGTWDRRSKAHLFSEDPRDALDQVLADGKFVDARREFDFFRTPVPLASELVALAQIRPGHFVLEPSAGDGRIATAVRAAHPQAVLVLCELNTKCQLALRDAGFLVYDGDFLTLPADAGLNFDRCVMNPPFSRGRDIDHVTHAWELLGRGGRLVAVMAAGVCFRQDRKATAFRELVDRHGELEPLPDGSFREEGTSVRTVRVVLEKP